MLAVGWRYGPSVRPHPWCQWLLARLTVRVILRRVRIPFMLAVGWRNWPSVRLRSRHWRLAANRLANGAIPRLLVRITLLPAVIRGDGPARWIWLHPARRLESASLGRSHYRTTGERSHGFHWPNWRRLRMRSGSRGNLHALLIDEYRPGTCHGNGVGRGPRYKGLPRHRSRPIHHLYVIKLPPVHRDTGPLYSTPCRKIVLPHG